MTPAVARQEVDDASIYALIANGDTSKLSAQQKLAYYKARCESAGLDPRAQPFQFIKLQGREVLYALKAATDQLAAQHKIRCEIVDQRTDNEIRVVTVRAVTADGRQTDEIGAVSVKGLQGEALCNALMKAVTKAKRRAVISITGLGMLDETELETIKDVTPAVSPLPTPRRKSEKKPEPESDLVPALQASLKKGAASDAGTTTVVADGAPSLVSEAAPPLCDPDTGEIIDEAGFDADLDGELLVNEKDVKSLWAAATEGGHKPWQVKAWLYREYGLGSSKEIKLGQLRTIRDRLRRTEALS